MFVKTSFAGSNIQYARFPFRDFVAAQKDLGISHIDLSGAVPHLWCDHLSPVQTEEIKNLLEDAAMKVTVFSPKAYRYSICAEPETVQASATLNYYQNCINAAVSLGCETVVLSPEGGCFDQSRNRLWDNGVHMLKTICEIAEQQKVTILLPSLSKELSPILTSLKEVEKMTAQVNSDALAVMLDIHGISMSNSSGYLAIAS